MKGTRSQTKNASELLQESQLKNQTKSDDIMNMTNAHVDIAQNPLIRDLKEEVGKLHRARFEDSSASTPIPMYNGDAQTLGALLDRFDVTSSAFSWSLLDKA